MIEYDDADREIDAVAEAAGDAIHDTIRTAHASGKYHPDSPDRPAAWRVSKPIHHKIRAIFHLLAEIGFGNSEIAYEAKAALERLAAAWSADPARILGSLVMDEGNHIDHAITRLAMSRKLEKP